MTKLKFFIISSLILFPLAGNAGFLDSISCVVEGGNCRLQDISVGFILLTQVLLGSMGAIALLYFVWGGIWWITSAGNQEKIKRGRDAMVGTSIAVAIAFGSFLILELWVNQILRVDESVAIIDECAGKTKGSSCQTYISPSLYKCTGNVYAGELAVYNEKCLEQCHIRTLDKAVADAGTDLELFQTVYVCAPKDRLILDPVKKPGFAFPFECPQRDHWCADSIFVK